MFLFDHLGSFNEMIVTVVLLESFGEEIYLGHRIMLHINLEADRLRKEMERPRMSKLRGDSP